MSSLPTHTPKMRSPGKAKHKHGGICQQVRSEVSATSSIDSKATGNAAQSARSAQPIYLALFRYIPHAEQFYGEASRSPGRCELASLDFFGPV